ncbi:hypothetical protein BO71DRAFT_156792 [Aspergillus ellipticus CBS 707.79]|uniref:Uncharacterized protein n=1 Tax=Aspergillus ellipticus CBS 707.79 TaxID=1448320 RepID=A0A319CU17_9EURO|nr:hypothetical protein BO71DRAFT_156792 [Aspergillus ellipticus CBS 707.79]
MTDDGSEQGTRMQARIYSVPPAEGDVCFCALPFCLPACLRGDQSYFVPPPLPPYTVYWTSMLRITPSAMAYAIEQAKRSSQRARRNRETNSHQSYCNLELSSPSSNCWPPESES